MEVNPLLLWLIFIVGGFLSGSIMYCQLLPKLILGKDISKLSADGNPGSANVFILCGAPMGFVCLFLDMMKGFVPVFWANAVLGSESILFAAVIAAPVLGHSTAIFNRFRGGKCIATDFGEMLALMPVTKIGWLLALIYILFSTVIKINPTRKRSIVTFVLFGTVSAFWLMLAGKASIALGCAAISAVTVYRHVVSAESSDSEKL